MRYSSMRTLTINKNVYPFSELSDKSKQRAIDKWRENSDFESEFTIEDIKTCAELFGLDIENVYFSGFCSQGDGACFIGSYSYKIGALKAVKEQYPLDETLHSIVQGLQLVQSKNFYRLRAKTSHRGHYYHAYCMPVEVWDDENQYRNLGEHEGTITQLLRDFADWGYKNLSAAYDYENSDSYIIEGIEANEYEFDEYGDII